MNRFPMKTSSMKGQMPFKERSVLDKTNLRITLSNESATDDTDKIGVPRFSLKQKFAALAVLLAGMNGFAYCHNTARPYRAKQPQRLSHLGNRVVR